VPKHYDNGSATIALPIPENRDYELSASLDLDSENGKAFYEQYYKGGSEFNSMVEIVASAGSQEVFLTLSGCKVTDMPMPSAAEGLNTYDLTIVPKSVSASVNDLVEKYNAW